MNVSPKAINSTTRSLTRTQTFTNKDTIGEDESRREEMEHKRRDYTRKVENEKTRKRETMRREKER